jgi:hypothetical protein
MGGREGRKRNSGEGQKPGKKKYEADSFVQFDQCRPFCGIQISLRPPGKTLFTERWMAMID